MELVVYRSIFLNKRVNQMNKLVQTPKCFGIFTLSAIVCYVIRVELRLKPDANFTKFSVLRMI